MNVFEEISEKEKNKLLKNLEAITISMDRNETLLNKFPIEIFKHSIVIVGKGKIEVSKIGYEGEKTILDVMEQNEVFGYLFSSINDEIEIIAKEESTLFVIEVQRIKEYKDTSFIFTQFLKNLFFYSSKMIEIKNSRIEIISNRGIRNKLLAFFNSQYLKSQKKTFELPISLTDLADSLGVDRSAMSREIKTLNDEGIILYKKRKITLNYKK